jgi:hypothetical protein
MKHQYIKKRDERKERRRISINEGAENLASDSGAYDIKKKKGETLKCKLLQEIMSRAGSDYIFEPIPEINFGYSLGGYSHRER